MNMLKLQPMPASSNIEKLNGCSELVICDSEISKLAHKDLFKLSDNAYTTFNESDGIINAIKEITKSCNPSPEICPSKIHLALIWENLLKIALWQAKKPNKGDVFTILRNAGITSEELQPLRTSDLNDVLPYLYYGKRFDILRKICQTAKRQMESNLKNHSTRIICHLIEEDTKKIVASSL